MAHKKILTLVIPLVLGSIALLLILPGKGQVQSPDKSKRRAYDENRYPIADYLAAEPTNPAERTKRRIRAEKHDKSQWGIKPEMVGDSTVMTHLFDPTLPALPFVQSSLVVVGHIKDGRAYLSKDKSGVYSSFTVQIDEIVKNSSKIALTTASDVEVEREGGRIKFPSGRIRLFIADRQEMPEVGGRYLLFLNNSADEPVFRIVLGYELKDGVVYALDDLPNAKSNEDANEFAFLNKVRTTASQP